MKFETNALLINCTKVTSREKNKDYYHCKLLVDDLLCDFQFISLDDFSFLSSKKKMDSIHIVCDLQEGVVGSNGKLYKLRLSKAENIK